MKRYNLYIDESGQANLTSRWNFPYFILAGIAIEERADKEVSAYFDHIKRRHGIQMDKNFHSVDFFENRKSSIYLSNAKARKFIVSLNDFLETLPVKVFVYSLHKEHVAEMIGLPDTYKFKGDSSHKEDNDLPYELLARKVFLSFGHYLASQKAYGSIIAESRRGSDKALLKTYLESQTPGRFEEKKYKQYSENFQTQTISICFENKAGLRGGLELADLYAYMLYQKLNKKIPLYESRGMKSLWQVIGKQIAGKDYNKSSKLLLSKNMFTKIGRDRIDKVTKKVSKRLADFKDLI